MKAQIKLLAPLSHGEFDPAGDGGNVMEIRRMPLIMPDGRSESVPCLSGNALRGRIRRLLMRDFLSRIGVTREGTGWDRIYAAVVNGGHLGKTGSEVDPERIAAVRAAAPPLSVLGAALYSWFLPGRVSVGLCWPVCDLTVEAAVVRQRAGVPKSSDIESDVYHSRLPDRDQARVADVTPMPHGTETLAAGVTLETDIAAAAQATGVEQACVMWGLNRIGSLGGQVARGFGRVAVTHDGPGENEWEEWLADDGHCQAAADMLREVCA